MHSTGANNPWLKRYVQPTKGEEGYDKLLTKIGKNAYNNSWNIKDINKCCHAFIGKLADGEIATAKILPWSYACWGCGAGKNGSYNYSPTRHIQFEVCEDSMKDKAYFEKVVKGEAVELCAYLCKMYNLKSSAVVSHYDAHKKGYASNHGDIDEWLGKFGYTMKDFRNWVAEKLGEQEKKPVVKYKTTTAKLALRSKSTTKSGIRYLYIPKGTKVEVITENVSKADGYSWDKIKYNNLTGFCANKYLK